MRWSSWLSSSGDQNSEPYWRCVYEAVSLSDASRLKSYSHIMLMSIFVMQLLSCVRTRRVLVAVPHTRC